MPRKPSNKLYKVKIHERTTKILLVESPNKIQASVKAKQLWKNNDENLVSKKSEILAVIVENEPPTTKDKKKYHKYKIEDETEE